MRDEERIDLYYRCGTIDWRSELARVNAKAVAGGSVAKLSNSTQYRSRVMQFISGFPFGQKGRKLS